ncbi:MAG: phosphoenolpyruvate synthase [Candidatus Pacearchaeota archaeon]|nr:phosphoenolpyruvate synthase [Candidatus Pacearchaeota archaeon]
MVDDSRNVVWLSEINKKDIAIAGGKGANLAEMYNSGFPVPPAFIVTAQAFATFLKESRLKNKILSIVNAIDLENTTELENKSKEIQRMIVAAKMPKALADEILEAYSYLSANEQNTEINVRDPLILTEIKSEPRFVAVRSSATTEDLSTASFAGQQETFLNIKGNEALLEAVQKCWASLFTARAIYYRTKKGFSHETSYIAVVVQRMVNSDKSGVMFTINPLNNNKDELVIESVFGLGEGIVSGTIEPDSYVIDKKKLEIVKKRLGLKKIRFVKDDKGRTIKEELPEEIQKKEVLESYELKSLANYGIDIEEHYKWPQDIEWAIEGKKIYILQSRPVTTIEKETKKVELQGKVLIEGLAASAGIASGVVKIIRDLKDLHKIKEGDILVTRMTNPDMVVTMQKAKAIVTDEGGLTAHAAIVSREIGLPCVVGTKKATQVLIEGTVVTVDGTNGKIYEGIVEPKEISEIKPSAETVPKPALAKMLIPPEVREAFELAKKRKEGVTEEIGKTLVKVNCDLPDVAERAAATGADGVGLVRIEFIIAKGGVHPAEYIRRGKGEEYSKLLADGIEKIAKAFQGKSVWVRTSDIRTDEYRNLEGSEQEPEEDNPMLGWHGIRRGLDDREILKAEFKAIKLLHDKGYKNVGIMLPFVIRVEEVRKAKDLCREIGLEPRKDVEFGVMIETPASCMIIEELCQEGIDFISFGTNDLTQLTLGIDRNNERLARLYDEMHPAVLRLLEMVITVCKSYGVKTSICGQAGSRPEMAKFLAKKGINSISANIDSVALIKEAIKEI